MPTLRIIKNIPKPIKIYTSKKTVLLYDRSSQPPVIVSQMSFIIPLENIICEKHCIFIKTLALCLKIPFKFEYINDINRYSLWKKCCDTVSYSKSVPYPMLNMLALLILATLGPAFQGNQILTKQNILDLIITQTESMSGYFLLEDKYKYKSLLQVCIHLDFSYKLKHVRNMHLILQILSPIQ